MIEDITTPQPYLKLYPPASQVFAEPVEEYARHLLPFVSIELAAVNKDWQGWLHLVSPVEPEEGCVGDNTAAFHNEWLRSNWIAFHLNADGRYELLGDFRYFTLENPAHTLQEAYPGQRDSIIKHYQEQHASYKKAVQRYAQHGVFYSANKYSEPKDGDYSNHGPCTIVDQLGGGQGWGNWCNIGGFPLDESDEDNIRPIAPDGKRFTFIASVTGWNYCGQGADSVLLFYESDSRTALLTFDWT